MNKELMNEILNNIKENDKILICRHTRPDGDAVGSTLGLKHILKDSFPNKDVRVINNDYAEYLNFLGEEDKEDLEFYKDSIAIIIDTSIPSRVSNNHYKDCKMVIRIDHHINLEPYGNLEWIEEEKSSASEMICEFYLAFKDELVLSKEAATCIYTGIVTDSGRFKFDSCNGDTLRKASVLLDKGIDVDSLFAHLYLTDERSLKLKGHMLNNFKITPNGVAYIYVTKKLQKKFNLTSDESSAMISVIESIKGCLMWIAFIDTPDKSIRVRLRSRFVNVNEIAEKYRGGGHAKASGGTVYNKKEINSLLMDADKVLKEYKENNEGWL